MPRRSLRRGVDVGPVPDKIDNPRTAGDHPWLDRVTRFLTVVDLDRIEPGHALVARAHQFDHAMTVHAAPVVITFAEGEMNISAAIDRHHRPDIGRVFPR